jgi:hypothetical protein
MSDRKRDEPAAGGAGGENVDELDGLDDEARAVLEEEGAPPALDEVEVRDLLRAALAPPPGAVAPELLRGVQRKIRKRSRGKFYGDGWSTSKSPRSTYLITSILMLALIALVFFVLIPWGGGALPLP